MRRGVDVAVVVASICGSRAIVVVPTERDVLVATGSISGVEVATGEVEVAAVVPVAVDIPVPPAVTGVGIENGCRSELQLCPAPATTA